MIEVDGLGPTLFCHGSPRSDEEIITRVTPAYRLDGILADVDESVVVCGHTHIQFDRTHAGKRLINAGSVGLAVRASARRGGAGPPRPLNAVGR